MRLTYHPDAEAELIEAAQFYERKVRALGSQFLDAANLQEPVELWNRTFGGLQP